MNAIEKRSSPRSLHAIVPINKLSKCKTRLSDFISNQDRRRLVLAMYHDVLTVLIEHPHISEVTIIAGESLKFSSEVMDFVQLIDEKKLDTVGVGLNSILAAGLDFIKENDNDDIMILHGDLPLLTRQDITFTLERLSQGDELVLGPDRLDEGTNLLAFRSGLRPEFSFGPKSLKAHLEWARITGLRVSCLKTLGVGLDIDTEMDFRELFAAEYTGLIGKFTATLISQIQMSEC